MKALWSLWSKPLLHGQGVPWVSYQAFLLSWVLSFELARKHYPETELVTDSAGARLLVDALGLEFSHVSTALDALRDEDPGWWSLGKMLAYQRQTEAFVHLDGDVFLWKPLPERLHAASVFAQNREPFRLGESAWYMPRALEDRIASARDSWLPEAWRWYRSRHGRELAGICCGILGGTDVGFLHRYAELPLRILAHPSNRGMLTTLGCKERHILLLEQFLLSAFIAFHQEVERPALGDTGGPFRVEFLFEGMAHAHQAAETAGYTHLIADAKRNPALAARLEKRVAELAPAHHARLVEHVRKHPSMPG